jgi:hypothetical protein
MLGPYVSLEKSLKKSKGYDRGYSKICRDISYTHAHSLNKGNWIEDIIKKEHFSNYQQQETNHMNQIRWNVTRKVIGLMDTDKNC